MAPFEAQSDQTENNKDSQTMKGKRFDIKGILADPVLRRRLMASSIQSIQAIEGRFLTMDEALNVYDRVQSERGLSLP